MATPTNAQIAAVANDILASDNGEFCDCVMIESVREQIDNAVQGICCAKPDDTDALLKFAKMIRSVAMRQLHAEAESIAAANAAQARRAEPSYFVRGSLR